MTRNAVWIRDRVGAVLVPLAVACTDAGQAGGVQEPVDLSNVPAFSADSAHAFLRMQVEFGPRVPGTDAHRAQLEWMQEHLRQHADTVIRQDFRHDVGQATLDFANLFARFRPNAAERVLLVAHWDTRQPIPGANDGASGTAVLLHLAEILSREPPPIGVDLLLVDGEDYGPYESNMYLGAKHFAANMPAGYAPLYGILLDMIGDQDPQFTIEGYSRSYAPEVVERVWRMAEQLGHGGVFVRRSGISISDDHVPLNKAGIRTIDVIDFDYGPGNRYWHTLDDDVERTSPRGLGAVGEVVTALIYRGG